MARLHRRDQVCIYFNNEDAAPYRMFGKFESETEDEVVIIGTVGEYIDKKFIIYKSRIKMIEVVEPTSKTHRDYDDYLSSWKNSDV